MENTDVVVGIIGSLVTAIGILALVIKSFLTDKPKTNGNGNGKQSRECWEQHQMVLSKLDGIERDVEILQKTMDSRTPLFRIVEEKLNDLNLSVSRWDGSDRRQS